MAPVLRAQGRGTLAIKAAREETATIRPGATRQEWKATRGMAPTLQLRAMQEAVRGLQVLDLDLDRDQEVPATAMAAVRLAAAAMAAAVVPAPAADLAVLDRVPELRVAVLAELVSVLQTTLLDRALLPRRRQVQAPPVPLGQAVQEAAASLQQQRFPRRILRSAYPAIERQHQVTV